MDLTRAHRALLVTERRATLATIAPDGRPRSVPCCFAIGVGGEGVVIDTPIDAKPKSSSDPMRLARVRDIRRDPRVTLLVDRWDEDWTRLAWLRVDGTARLLLPWAPPDAAAHAGAVRALRGRYPQYATQRLETLPIIRIAPARVTSWAAATEDEPASRN
jgi:PPOX class probable F420-dependent enzyme